MRLLATYETPLGNEIELHYKDGRFWTERRFDKGVCAVYCDRERAHEHWEYAAEYGRLHAAWPREVNKGARW